MKGSQIVIRGLTELHNNIIFLDRNYGQPICDTIGFRGGILVQQVLSCPPLGLGLSYRPILSFTIEGYSLVTRKSYDQKIIREKSLSMYERQWQKYCILYFCNVCNRKN